MATIDFKQISKHRKAAIEQLKGFVINPGRFSILILGARGTGKSYWLRHSLEKMEEKEAYHKVDAMLAQPNTEYWEKEMEKANGVGCLYIKDVEKLSRDNQAILFNALYTTDGKFGLEEKKYTFRIVFTSTLHISMLRDTEQYLMHYFFDRIAQLIVKFPDFTEASDKIENDFKETWKKFQFDTNFPEEILPWLKEKAHTFHGNFRDLDKLCIIWNNHQLSGLQPDEILKKVKEEFIQFYRFPEKKNEANFEVIFSRDKQWSDTLNELKLKFKQWAQQEFGTLKKAEKALSVNHRTMERW